MKTRLTFGVGCGLLLLAALAAVSPASRSAGAADQPLVRRQQIEADWLRQELVRRPDYQSHRYDVPASVRPEQDAAGAVDGIKDGTLGLPHGRRRGTVVAGRPAAGRSRSTTCCCTTAATTVRPPLARRIRVLLVRRRPGSGSRLYQHDGTVFLGQPDGKPLKVSAERRQGAVRAAAAAGQRLPAPGRGRGVPAVEASRRTSPCGKPAAQSSVSQWSAAKIAAAPGGEAGRNRRPWPAKDLPAATQRVIDRGRQLAGDSAPAGRPDRRPGPRPGTDRQRVRPCRRQTPRPHSGGSVPASPLGRAPHGACQPAAGLRRPRVRQTGPRQRSRTCRTSTTAGSRGPAAGCSCSRGFKTDGPGSAA